MSLGVAFTIILTIIILVLINKGTNENHIKSFSSYFLDAQAFLQEVKTIKCGYFTYSQKQELKAKYQATYSKLNSNMSKRLIKADASNSVEEFISVFSGLDLMVPKWNEIFVDKVLTDNKTFFDNIDGRSLDYQQRRCVVVDEDNCLVLAGAGSGKTLTISAKVKYLVEKLNVPPDEILLLSFTRKSANEMTQRIVEKLNIQVEATTFHSLGLRILFKSGSYRPNIVDENETNRIYKEFLETIVKNDPVLVDMMVRYFGFYYSIPFEIDEDKSLGDMIDERKYLDFETLKSKLKVFQSKTKLSDTTIHSRDINTHDNPLDQQCLRIDELNQKKQTLAGEKVKSFEELLIANYLFLNGILYEYESTYPHSTGDLYRKTYRPDFYLTEYDIYIEHFGVNEKLEAPWLPSIESKKYTEGIHWKRKVHRDNGTILIETYSYMNRRGTLLDELERLLEERGVKLYPIDSSLVYESLLNGAAEDYQGQFKTLITSFISLFKSNGYQTEDFRILSERVKKDQNIFTKKRSEIFLGISKAYYEFYQKRLSEKKQIDFNDMINEATIAINNMEIKLPYSYIVVDEYQDISNSRSKLVEAIKRVNKAKLVAVGDDWQSIYRFAGSDISLFTNFSDYFGYTEVLRIESTYRNSQELIDVASSFILKNKKQLPKTLKSQKHYSNPVRVFGYDRSLRDAFFRALDEIGELSDGDADVLVLGRNNSDFKKIVNIEQRYEESAIVKSNDVSDRSDGSMWKYRKFPNLSIKYLTVHKSKGLESDYTIVINLENSLYGFPNRIADDPLLSLVLTDKEEFEFAEERRLFYVALTRTKNSTYLITPVTNKSIFVDELIKSGITTFEFSTGESNIGLNPNCPLCRTGVLLIRENAERKRAFLGCSNYPLCDRTFKEVEILNNQIICPSCRGYMVRRTSKLGSFYGCTNYPYCKSTIDIIDHSKKVLS